MSELRYYGFKIHVQNEDGTTKVRQFRRAVSDVDDTVELLNSTLGENISVTAKKVQGDKEAEAIARRTVTVQERQKRKTEQVVTQYTRLNQTIRQYGDNAEVVNAITRLGSNATETQKQEVAELVQEYQRLRNAGDGTRSSFRNLRGVTQNLGWQIQDVAVQAQMGTNWFTIIAQQGSQMAAAFGATGALIGAGLAVGFAMMPAIIEALGQAETSIKEVEEAQRNLNKVFDSSAASVNGLSSEMEELYKVDERLARLKAFSAMGDAELAIEGFRKSINEGIGGTLDKVNNLNDRLVKLRQTTGTISSGLGGPLPLEVRLANTNSLLDANAEKLGVTRDQITSLASAYTNFTDTGDTEQLVEVFDDLLGSSSQLTPEFRKLAGEFVDGAIQGKLAEDQLKRLNEMMENGIDVTGDQAKEVEDLALKYNRMTAELQMNQRQQALNNFWMDDAADLTREQRNEVLQSINAYFDQKEAIEATNEALEERKQLEEDLSKVQGKLDPSRGALDTTLDQVETLQKALDAGKISEREFQRDSLRAWQDYYTKVAKLHATGGKGIEDAEESTRTFTENVGDLWSKLSTPIQDLTADQADSIGQLAEKTQQQLGVMSSAATMFGSTIDTMVNGTQRVQEATKDMNSAQKAAFLLMQGIAAAEAIIQGLVLGSKLATMFANPALLAVGAGIGGAQAGAIMGTTFAGAFDKGGYIPSGQMGIVSEYGDELVNGRMVSGPARVVGREETARRQGGDGGQAVVKIYNAPGQTAQVSQNSMGETEVRIIAQRVFNENIDSGVSGVLSDSRSKSTKAMKNNYQAPRKI